MSIWIAIYLALQALGMGIIIAQHGQVSRVHAGYSAIGVAINLFLLYMGGVFFL